VEAGLTFIRVKEWETYQHYKDRNPPWIKLHRGTLTSNTWVSLDDASRVLAIAIMLLAAEKGNRIPAKPDYLKRVAYLHSEPDLRPLVEVGFIELVEENGETASTLQATARPERETEKNREEKKDLGAQARSKRGSRIPEGWEPSPAGIEFARKSGLDPVVTLAEFRDYWTAASGQKASKLDWEATWRTWCRNAQNFKPRKPLAGASNGYQAPSSDGEDRRLQAYASMIRKGITPGLNFRASDRHKLITAGLVTLEQCERAGCAA
jgi:hypothetical protein